MSPGKQAIVREGCFDSEKTSHSRNLFSAQHDIMQEILGVMPKENKPTH